MRSFRMATSGPLDRDFSTLVIGHRMPMPEAVRTAAAMSWFAFHFHHPVTLGTIDGNRTLPAESVIIIARGEPLSHEPVGRVLNRSWIRCDGEALPGMLAEAGLRTRMPYRLAPDSEALPALLTLHRACVHRRGATPPHQRALFSSWLHAVARDQGPGPAPSLGIDEVRRHLETAYLQPQRLDALATRAGCSRAQLCRRFRRAVGCSPIHYVLRLRLETARELLLTTDRGITTIAESCGFSDRYHFSRAFSAAYGQGPATCRRGHRH